MTNLLPYPSRPVYLSKYGTLMNEFLFVYKQGIAEIWKLILWIFKGHYFNNKYFLKLKNHL